MKAKQKPKPKPKPPSPITDGPGFRKSVVGTPFVRVTIVVTRELRDTFREVAALHERTVSAELRKLMQEVVDEHERSQDRAA